MDATTLHAPSSTKNASGGRAPEMHQTKKGKQWRFGLKAHIGVDAKEGHVHSVATSARRGRRRLSRLTRDDQRCSPRAQDMTCRRTKFKEYGDTSYRKIRTRGRGVYGPR
jgi:transposase, IS5 family